jgi:hypothetical protein
MLVSFKKLFSYTKFNFFNVLSYTQAGILTTELPTKN